MKKIASSTIILIVLFFALPFICHAAPSPVNDPGSEITVYTVPALTKITSTWASEYGKQNPDIKVKVIETPETTLQDNLKNTGGLGFITTGANEDHPWKIILGRSIIVPVMSSKNPYLDDIFKHGIAPSRMARSLDQLDSRYWESLLDVVPNAPVHFIITENESVRSKVSDYFHVSAGNSPWTIVGDEKALLSSLERDPYAIGFCRLNDILDDPGQALPPSVRILPIDKNGNGKLDYMEDIYSDLESFTRGVWIGKYPKELSGAIYSVSAEQPVSQAETSFLTWVLTDGQQFLSLGGYSDLVYSERQSQLDKISFATLSTAPVKTGSASLGWVILGVFLFLAAAFALGMFLYRIRVTKEVNPDAVPGFGKLFDENSILVPKGLLFDKTHTWAFMEEDGRVKIGIDDFLQHITGPITRIEMKKPGENIKKGEVLFSIVQNGKQLTLYAPVTGKIIERNSDLSTHSSSLNTAPYSQGWVYRIEPVNWALEMPFLSLAEKYREGLSREFTRLKDFLAQSLRSDQLTYSHLVLQDGGVLKDGVLADLGPGVWEDFQTKFMDVSR